MNNQDEINPGNYGMLKCIWMASGVIEYKLCDKKFDCENCQFDKVIRNFSSDDGHTSSGIPTVINIILHKLVNIKYDDKIIYLRNNLIARQILPNTYYLGVNPILISYLDNVGMMIECNPGRNVSSGQTVMNFFGEWGTVNLTAPINFSIYDKVNNPADDPMKSKWFAIIGAIPQEISAGRVEYSEWEILRQKSINTIEEIKLSYPKIGPTMQDGGSQIKYLHQLLGKERYLEVLKSLIS
jgi:hypothetical protein